MFASSSSSAFPAISLGFTIIGEIFATSGSIVSLCSAVLSGSLRKWKRELSTVHQNHQDALVVLLRQVKQMSRVQGQEIHHIFPH